jgi:hypothetical protein
MRRYDCAQIRRVRARHVPVPDKSRKFVGTDGLLDLRLHLVDRATALPTERRRAIAFRDGFILAFLTPRLKNFAGLRLDQHLQMAGEAWIVAIPAEETKTGSPQSVSLAGTAGPSAPRMTETVAARSFADRTVVALRRGAPVGIQGRFASDDAGDLRSTERSEVPACCSGSTISNGAMPSCSVSSTPLRRLLRCCTQPRRVYRDRVARLHEVFTDETTRPIRATAGDQRSLRAYCAENREDLRPRAPADA